jgi:hypothetical protein
MYKFPEINEREVHIGCLWFPLMRIHVQVVVNVQRVARLVF